MEITLKVSLDEASLGALNALTSAIAGFSGKPVNSTASSAATATKTESSIDETAGPIYWADSKDGQFGKVNKEAEYAKLKKKSDTVYKIPETKYQEMQESLREKNEAAKNAKKEAEKPAAKKEAEATDDEVEVASLEDVIAVFSEYLPKTLDVEERKARAGFVKPMLERFGAAKATEIPEEHRALAINLVQRKMAGEDVDPKTAKFAAVKAKSEEAEDDLV